MSWDETEITVRFNEVDSYQVAWHGHYVAWMEIGRNNLSGQFGLGPDDLLALGYQGPVVSLELKYLRPALFNDVVTIRTWLEDDAAAMLRFRCEMLSVDGQRLATGLVCHALTDMNGVLQYRLPVEVEQRVANMRAWLDEGVCR
ncbi:acyl-CoA thioesterase [Trichlorobacter lovleyi]|jgi:Predicted thioesterase|uniref:Thioesterase superfamily protein n=1 Tax=Trichlorobacter lovleyi (strain ATCC BAA-1151 / DSM 17278 / SZ) TaxID=398767 RepID=B3E491_TRIL1|nr:acyl-CoA thioesterase [Trichlorobacter lovleyi]ACD95912.1 thioesterase superfamily protein [Trichlorobacter lovleyi SZ]